MGQAIREVIVKRYLILAICAVVFIVSSAVHLLDRGHYYVVNYDSFWFHMVARQITEGHWQPVVGSGVAYPLAGLASIVGMRAATAVLPIVLGLLTGLALFLGVRRLYSERRALMTVVCFTVALPVHFYFLAGNIDRDCLHFLLVTSGMLGLGLFWKERHLAWLLVPAACVIGLTIEWGWLGPVVFLPLAAGASEVMRWDFRAKGPYVVLITAGLVMYAAGRLLLSRLGWSGIAELQPVNTLSILEYSTIVVALVWGIARTGTEENNWPLAWLLVSLVLSCFAVRFGEFGIIGACILGGAGLEYIWDHKKEWVAVFAVGVLLFAGLSWKVPENMTLPPDWQQALEWVHDRTPPGARVMAVGDYAHWIQDIAEREPDTEVGMQDDKKTLAQIYTAESDQVVADLMEQHDCQYLMVSSREKNFTDAVCDPPWPFYDTVPSSPRVVFRNATVFVLAYPEGL